MQDYGMTAGPRQGMQLQGMNLDQPKLSTQTSHPAKLCGQSSQVALDGDKKRGQQLRVPGGFQINVSDLSNLNKGSAAAESKKKESMSLLDSL